MARIELRNLRKDWPGVTAVDGINLRVDDGSFVALLGPSGCGKSTTLFMLAGIYSPSDGEILFDGARVNEVEARDRNIGIVFQSYALYPHMTAAENIGFPLRFQGLEKAEADHRVAEAAALVQVDQLLQRRPAQLSGGQQQRVALARALVKRPRLLLLDEPLSNLDAALRLTMRSEIRRLQRHLGITTILVTHDQIEATTMADRVVVMNRGRIEQEATAEDTYRRPRSLFVAGFIGAPPINLVPALAAGDRVTAGEVGLRASRPVTGEVVVGVRPEHLRLAASGVHGRVAAIEPMGREVLLALDGPLGRIHLLIAVGAGMPAEGAQVHVDFDPADTLLFDRSTSLRIEDVTLTPDAVVAV
ncbi:MAG: ABC transporter ATP-binding protein [Proteobacteria bacterium]|nr:ABC transporter ATP-binding protein [Pseudomonadota bacterium]